MPELDEITAICPKCAKKRGGKWKIGHDVTTRWGKCGMCGLVTWVVGVSDWDWSVGKRRNDER